MTAADEEEQQLRIELMKTQIDHNRINMTRLRQEMRLEPYKAVAAFLAAAAAIGGIIVALAHWTHL